MAGAKDVATSERARAVDVTPTKRSSAATNDTETVIDAAGYFP